MSPTLRDWLREAPFSLAMSSGFFAFFAHAGFLSVLEDEQLLPQRLYGSSAGALTAGIWSSGVSTEVLGEELCGLSRQDFWDPRPGLGLLRGALFRARLEKILRTTDFASCRVPLAVSVYELRTRSTRVLRSGPLAPALQASCSVPLLFQPVRIDGRLYVDGGVADRPGLAGAQPGERILYHHIVSRSPWRSARSMQIPERAGMTTVALRELPRLGPFRLTEGREAFQRARRKMQTALASPHDARMTF